jgi:hypothetical protein
MRESFSSIDPDNNNNNQRRSFTDVLFDNKGKIATGLAIGTVVTWALSRYKVARPNEFLALTGPG